MGSRARRGSTRRPLDFRAVAAAQDIDIEREFPYGKPVSEKRTKVSDRPRDRVFWAGPIDLEAELLSVRFRSRTCVPSVFLVRAEPFRHVDRPELARCSVSYMLVIHRGDGDAAISSSVALVNGTSGGQTEARIEARWKGELLGTLEYGPETIAETAAAAKFRFEC